MPAPITAEDLYLFEWIGHVRIHPAGDRVVYEIGWADRDERENRSRLVVHPLAEGAQPEALTPGPHDSAPEWSAGGALAFIRKADHRRQVFVIPAGGGEARQVTAVPEGVGSYRWSPDGSRIAFTTQVLADEDGVVDDPRPPESSEQTRRAPVARIARRLDYKFDGKGYFDGRRSHLFVVDAAGGEPQRLTTGSWDVGAFSWAPDGERLAVTGNADPEGDRTIESHIYEVRLDGGVRQLVGGRIVEAVEWSPDPDRLAFVAPLRLEGGLFDRLWFLDVNSGEARCVTEDLDRSVGDGLITDMRAGHDLPLRWSPDAQRVAFLSTERGRTGVLVVDSAGGVEEPVRGRRRVYDFDWRGDGFTYLASDTDGPGDLFAGDRRLTQLNGWLRERYVAQPEHLELRAPDGWDLEGWLLKPDGFDPAGQYPLVLEVHGGPHGAYGWAFFHEFQVLAGTGLCVLYLNPRGSDGYGESFMRAVVRDWGGADFQDLMAGLEQVVERGFVDPARLGIGGGSYGGFMTNWAVGQTDRFAAAVAMRSISNLVSDYGQNDIVPWSQLEMGPAPWPDLDELWRRSPIRYVQNVRTPLLLTHGEMDLRCPISQAEEMFGALRLLGRTVELARFPDESHDLSRGGRPDRRVERLNRIAGWFAKYLLPASARLDAQVVRSAGGG